MLRLLKRYFDLSIRKKMGISYIIIVLFISVFMTLSFSIAGVSRLEGIVSAYAQSLVVQIDSNLTSTVQKIQEEVFQTYLRSDLNRYQEVVEIHADDPYGLKKAIFYQGAINDILYSVDYVDAIIFVDLYGEIYDYGSIDTTLLRSIKSNLMSDIARHRNTYMAPSWESGNEHLVLMKRALYDSNNMEYIGFIVIGVNISRLVEVFESIDPKKVGHFTLVDSSRNILYSTDPTLDSRIINEIGKNSSHTAELVIRDGNAAYLVRQTNIPGGGIGVISIIPPRIIRQFSNSFRVQIIFIALAAIILAFFLVLPFRYSISSNLLRLQEQIHAVSSGNFSLRIHPHSKDEIGSLAEELNQLAYKMQELMDNVIEEKERHREIEYRLLESQYNTLQAKLNPHLLYNALEAVNSIASINGDERISTIVCLIAQVLRESLSRRGKVVRIDHEIAFIEDYLKLYQEIYRGKISYRMDVDQTLLTAIIPSFIIQPLVENSIVHGLQYKVGGGEIVLSLKKENEDISLEVSDNGVGMSSEELSSVTNPAPDNSENSKHSGIGIPSVAQRLRMLYKPPYGLEIESTINKGTVTRVRIPFQEAENDENI